MRILEEGTKVMLTATIISVRKDSNGETMYCIDIDGNRFLPPYVSQEAVKVAPWFGDDGK